MGFKLLTSLLTILFLYFSLLLSYTISIVFIEDKYNHPLDKYIWLPMVYFLTFLITEFSFNRIDKNSWMLALFKGNIISFVLVLIIFFFTKEIDEYSRLIQIVFFISNFILPFFIEAVFFALKRIGLIKVKLMLISDEESLPGLKKWIDDNFMIAYDIVKIVNPRNIKKEIFSVKTDDVNYILISTTENKINSVVLQMEFLQSFFKRVIYIPKDIPYFLGNAKTLYTFSHKNFAIFVENKLLEKSNIVLKRIFDVIFSIILFIIFFIPMILIYLLILITQKENPIYKHERIGQNGKIFYVLKFRTMKKNADVLLQNILKENPDLRKEWEENFKLKNDPRVTKIGRFLRKTSLDELPQIINVIKGDMSLVGPRPIIKDEIVKYGEWFNFYKLVKPGITGLWQISGRSNLSYEERVKLDIWYIKNWSVEMDIFILLKTAIVFFKTKDSF